MKQWDITSKIIALVFTVVILPPIVNAFIISSPANIFLAMILSLSWAYVVVLPLVERFFPHMHSVFIWVFRGAVALIFIYYFFNFIYST